MQILVGKWNNEKEESNYSFLSNNGGSAFNADQIKLVVKILHTQNNNIPIM